MGKVTGFLEIDRADRRYAPASDRIRHYREFMIPLSEEATRNQAARCMNCGIPYCHNGCPVNNQIPDWNDLAYRGEWQEAARNLLSTNNFPEFTGRVCPAPCEASCTLNIQDTPVTIKTIECAIIDRAFAEGWIHPEPPATKSGKSVAVVGSGPAGLACAQQLARAGHDVHVYEKQAKAGGLLRYGIPDFKLEKRHVDRRVEQMEAEGRRLPLQRACRRDGERQGAGGAPRRDCACGRRRGLPRPAGPRARPRRSPFRDGVPAAAEPARFRRAAGDQQADPGQRQERRGDRRRRHGLRLHRHLDPPGRAQGDAARDPADAAKTRGQAAHLAELAPEAQNLVKPRGRRRAGIRGDDDGFRGRERRRDRAQVRPRRRQAEAGRRARNSR